MFIWLQGKIREEQGKMGLGRLAGTRPRSALEFWLKIFVVIQRPRGSLDSVQPRQSHIQICIFKYMQGTDWRLKRARVKTGRQKRSYSPSKGYGMCHGSGAAGMRMGYGGGEGETGIKDFPLSVVFILFQASCVCFLLTEQRQNQALPHSSWNTKEGQPGLNFVKSS